MANRPFAPRHQWLAAIIVLGAAFPACAQLCDSKARVNYGGIAGVVYFEGSSMTRADNIHFTVQHLDDKAKLPRNLSYADAPPSGPHGSFLIKNIPPGDTLVIATGYFGKQKVTGSKEITVGTQCRPLPDAPPDLQVNPVPKVAASQSNQEWRGFASSSHSPERRRRQPDGRPVVIMLVSDPKGMPNIQSRGAGVPQSSVPRKIEISIAVKDKSKEGNGKVLTNATVLSRVPNEVDEGSNQPVPLKPFATVDKKRLISPTPAEYDVEVVAADFEPSLFIMNVSFDAVSITDMSGKSQRFQIDANGHSSVTMMVPPEIADLAASIEGASVSRLTEFPNTYANPLPFSGWRSPDRLAFLLPGVSPAPLAVGRQSPGIAPGVGTAGEFSVNGLRGRDNSFLVDGSDNNDEDIGVRRRGIVAAFPQPIESLTEFSVVTGLANSTYGRGISGFADALTRTGTSSFHGSVWGFATTAPFKAADFLTVNNSAYPGGSGTNRQQVMITADGSEGGTPVPFNTSRSTIALPFQVNSLGNAFQPNPTAPKEQFLHAQSGFVLTGFLPVDQHRTTFTLSYERRTQRQSEQENFAVATPLERQICGPTQSQCTSTFFDPNAPRQGHMRELSQP